MRIFLLRLLLGWWMIPCAWFFIYPIGWLVDGKDAKETIKDFCHVLWYGMD